MKISPRNASFKNPTGFIVLEGVNGAGKTTLQKAIASFLASHGVDVVTTREPGATPAGQAIRSLVLSPREDKLSAEAELLLFAADRAEHVAKLIRPTLARGAAVISDRYLYSTVAFQGYGRGLNRQTIDSLNTIASGDTLPDFVILLDLDAQTGLARTQGRAALDSDAMENEAIDFHNRIRMGFLEIAERSSVPFIVIDASQAPDAMFAELRPTLEGWLDAFKERLGTPRSLGK